ncbi:hypothetical protein [Maritalea sp.]|uniref:hypothetical protein n=1 Tax=Maritalea sp. TaxID=2003361 RepID=UPI003EF7EC88
MKDVETNSIPDLAAAIEKAASQQPSNHLEIDLERYQGYLDNPSLTPEQKTEFLEKLWIIVSAFVELGFGVHPVQQACGKHGTELDPKANSESTGIEPEIDTQHQETDAPAI